MDERLGNREKAAQAYRFADLELQPYVDEARAALARGGEQGR